MMDQLHEECGVFGVYDNGDIDVVSACYLGLFALQHRGQESCGIVVNDDGVFTTHKDIGLVNDVFTKENLLALGKGQIAVGHVRYSTTGASQHQNAQPMVVNHIKGATALAHNGNLTNAFELRKELELEGSIFHTTSDTEVISYLITKARIHTHTIEDAVLETMGKLRGAYSLCIMSPTKLLAARDPLGFRPLCIGTIGDSYVVASETCALDVIGATYLRDVEPGEVVVIGKDGLHSIRDHVNDYAKKSVCVFEYIYFARPDSVIDGCSVHQARRRAGELLAQECPVEADVVIGVPDSGLDAALGYSQASGIPYGMGFIKNKYVARTFIAPDQKMRENKVRIKLNVLSSVVRGKRVIMIDDSIVRGTTSAQIVKLLRDSGATEVHVRVSAPPFKHPCFFGVDIDSRENLIANNHSVAEIAEIIGADTLGYLSIDAVHQLTSGTTPYEFCDACFSGRYTTQIPDTTQKNKFERKLSEKESEE
ncbi:MAG: amidophosphoribosyltransferase [Clostridia bacterium]|nr:amidophosphoribosyltransferase [Clostridia bacterium]